jgi:hypothetical protein
MISRAISTMLAMGLATFLFVSPVLAQCENCLGSGGMPEECDSNEGEYGYENCYLFLGFLCGGSKTCDMGDGAPMALALGFDGMRRSQMTEDQIVRATAHASSLGLLGDRSNVVSGPALANPEISIRAWTDCRGNLKGLFQTESDKAFLRRKTDLIVF